MSRPLCCLWLLALAGCDAATNAKNPGPPLATVHGTMTLGSSSVTGPVRLAVAWYPSNLLAPSSLPSTVITQNVTYTGNFPQSFAFELFEPPPANAQVDNLGQGHVAIGLLIAYQDGNGNGELDNAQGGAFVDEVLGVSTGATMFDPRTADQWFISWSDTDQPGLPKGFTAIRLPAAGDQQNLPIDSAQIPIVLTGDPRLNLWICPEEFDFDPLHATNVACGLTRSLNPPQLGVFGSIDASGHLILAIGMNQNLVFVPNVTGTLNGKALPPPTQTMFGSMIDVIGPETDWLAPGTNTLTLSDGVDPAQTATFEVPQPFSVSAPLAGPVTPPFDVSWTASTGAVLYEIAFARGNTPAAPNLPTSTYTADTQAQITAPLPAGTGHLLMTVRAESADPRKGTHLEIAREITIDLGP